MRVLDNSEEKNEDVATLFEMLEAALEEIEAQKRAKQNEKDSGTKFLLPKDMFDGSEFPCKTEQKWLL